MTRVLIVEDDGDLRATLQDTLTDEGYQVDCAANGREALDRLRAHAGPDPDLILLDLVMPIMNGWQFRAAQKNDRSLAQLPTVVMTATPNLDGRGVDADDFLPKPIELPRLLETVRRNLGALLEVPDELTPLLSIDDLPAGRTWMLAGPAQGESCRWESADREWITIAVGENESLGTVIVRSSTGRRQAVDSYEAALTLAKRWRQ